MRSRPKTDTPKDYRIFDPAEAKSSISGDGFDAWAEEYSTIPHVNPINALTRQLLYEYYESRLERHILKHNPGLVRVLDFNCGCGNDFPYFLSRGYNVTGCDGSAGMLSVAHCRFVREIEAEMVTLYWGQAEAMTKDSFGRQEFDLVFSTTGGFSYVDDCQFRKTHAILLGMLKPHGHLLVAHLTLFCLGETAYFLLRLKPRMAVRRWRRTLTVNIRGRPQRMYLRTASHVRRLLENICTIEALDPLLAYTPPFQTGYCPGERLVRLHARVERALRGISLARSWADQAICLCQPLPAAR